VGPSALDHGESWQKRLYASSYPRLALATPVGEWWTRARVNALATALHGKTTSLTALGDSFVEAQFAELAEPPSTKLVSWSGYTCFVVENRDAATAEIEADAANAELLPKERNQMLMTKLGASWSALDAAAKAKWKEHALKKKAEHEAKAEAAAAVAAAKRAARRDAKWAAHALVSWRSRAALGGEDWRVPHYVVNDGCRVAVAPGRRDLTVEGRVDAPPRHPSELVPSGQTLLTSFFAKPRG
jgi:hypothetical protein